MTNYSNAIMYRTLQIALSNSAIKSQWLCKQTQNQHRTIEETDSELVKTINNKQCLFLPCII